MEGETQGADSGVVIASGLADSAFMKQSITALAFALGTPFCLEAQEDLVFANGSEWEVVSDGHQFAEGMAWDADGHFIFTDVPRAQLFRVDKATGEKTLLDGETGRANGIAFGPDGKLYGCSRGADAIARWDPATWKRDFIGKGGGSNDIAILDDGTIFFTDPQNAQVWTIPAGSSERAVAQELPWKPNGIGLSIDQKTLLVAEFDSSTVHGFAINSKSHLTGRNRPAYRFAIPSNTLNRLDGMQPLKDGRLMIGTALGTQIAPPVGGKGELIVIPSPEGRSRCNYARISPDNTWLYTAYAKDVLRRKLKPGFGL